MLRLLFGLLVGFTSSQILATDLDRQLQDIIKKNDLKPLERAMTSHREKSRLGAMLFHETELSGNKDINCAACHHPMLGTSDALPFSIGAGAQGLGPRRMQGAAGVTKRHSPHLINLGYSEIEHMFWDGRVHRDSQTGVLNTPEPALNGKNPQAPQITKALSSSLATQVIFPIVNELEMMGTNNDVARAFKKGGNLAAWKAVMDRLLEGEQRARYTEQFAKAYPGLKDFNIGHLGDALGAFLSQSFNLIDTPYDRYLKGDSTAMTESEKRGLVVFAGRGQCIQCHNGSHLSNFEFKTVGTPQLTPGSIPAPYDQGRFEVTGNKSDLFKFKTPALRNLAATAPYMHNGVFETLEEVIEHYNDPKKSLDAFDVTDVDLSNYTEDFVVDRDPLRNKLRINLISIGEVRRGVNLTEQEKADLLAFLKTGLLDFRFQRGR